MAREMKDSGIEWIGEIPTHYQKYRIKNVAKINGRIGFRGYTTDDLVGAGEGPLTLSPSNIRNMSMNYDKCTYIAWHKYNESPEIQVHDGDILMVKTGSSYGKTAMVVNLPMEATINPQLVIIRNFSIVPRFLNYYFHTEIILSQIANAVVGGTIPTMAQEKINNFFFFAPSIEEQRRIADFLDRQCAEIDAVIERTRATIEEYRKLKQAVITEAVTKGIRGSRPMKDSGIEWIKEIPVEWNSINPKALFTQRKDKARAGQRQLTASQQHGIIYQDEYMELTGSKVVTVEKDFDILKQVEAGDFVISMRSFQGGLEYSNLSGSISSAYVMLIPNLELVYPRFFRWLLKSPIYINALQSTSNMVRDGQAMRYSNFAQVRLYTVPLDEQAEIADYLDERCSAIDKLIIEKNALLTELETYKKSLIYEYVTGKRECPSAEQQMAVIYPFYPAKVKAYSPLFGQAVLASRILDECHENTGRVKLEKILFTIEYSIGFDSDTEYQREVAGPFHPSIYKCEGIIGNRNKWFTIRESKHGVSYTPTADKDKYKPYYNKYFGEYATEIDRIISVFKGYSMVQAEIIATLFAAWNDAIIDGKQFTDEDIVDDVLNNWNDSKQRFGKDVWLRAMQRMKENNIVPKGYGRKTTQKT